MIFPAPAAQAFLVNTSAIGDVRGKGMHVNFPRLAQLTASSIKNVYRGEVKPLLTEPSVVHARRRLRHRVGLLGYKRGMVPYFDSQGQKHACTLIEIDRCQVVDVKRESTHGYNAVQLGCGARAPSNVTRSMLGHFARASVAPKRDIGEFQVRFEENLPALGTQLKPSQLIVGQFVDIQSKSKGKGFQGVMKRWGFAGQPASHGVSVVHRSAGSIGQCQDPGRVVPGKKMAGRMGFDNITVQNLEVMETDDENGLVLIKGHVAGPPGRLVRITDAIKKPLPARS